MKTHTSGWEVAEVIGCTLAVIADIAGAPFRNKRKE